MPDLRQLRAFVAVAEQLSFTRAAEQLHLKQQSVSKTVRELERELGVALLERTTREVRVTAAGLALLASGRDLLRRADRAFAEAREVGQGLSGTVRIGITPPIGPSDHAEVVRALRERGPEVSVALRELRPGDLDRSLRAGEVEIALSRTAGHEVGLDRAELRPTPMVICLPAGHRLAGAETIRLAELDGERLLTASPVGTAYTDLLLERSAAAGATLTPVEARVTGGSALLTQLADVEAVALVPVETPAVVGTVVVAIEDDLRVPLLLLWPAGLPSPAVRCVRDALGLDR